MEIVLIIVLCIFAAGGATIGAMAAEGKSGAEGIFSTFVMMCLGFIIGVFFLGILGWVKIGWQVLLG